MNHQENNAANEGGLQDCPIPTTHRRLRHAHALWHQALESYHRPDTFHANLNAAIQTLRSVTFILQKEKGGSPTFDEWYGPWQEKLKDDALSKWLNDARVTVFHVGDLDSYSSAEVRLVTWRQEVLSIVPIPIQMPAELLLENPTLLSLLDPLKRTSPESEDGFLMIERRWSTKDLAGKEILSVLAHVYGLIADLVLDAHGQFGRMNCIPSDAEHEDFPSQHDRTGVLRCMLASVEARTERFTVATRERLVVSTELDYTTMASAEVAQRYGFDEQLPELAVRGFDPLSFAKKLQFMAKRILRRDKHHLRMMFIRDGRGQWHNVVLVAKDRTEKYVLMQLVAQFVEAQGCDAIVEVGEVWTAIASSNIPQSVRSIEELPGRGEALVVMVATREGLLHWYLTPIKRGPLGGIKLSDTVEVEKQQLPYFEPVIDVWRRQGMFRLQDGTRSQVWEPDTLDLCPCGGEERYGQCCRSRIAKLREMNTDVKEEHTDAGNDPTQHEGSARAALARYVIWTRQHTAAALESGHSGKEFYDRIVQIDVLALASLIKSMIRALVAADKADLVLPQLRRLRGLVGVPRVEMRVTAMTARWLFDCDRPEEAVLEMDALGNPFGLEDSLALSLVAQHADLSTKEKSMLLRMAIDKAAADEEKHLARLNLALHLWINAEIAEAESIVRLIIEDTQGDDTSTERSAALILLWKITNASDDFKIAAHEMEKDDYTPHRYRNASYLIEGEKYAEAERLLSKLVESGDLEAKLLIVDARIRSGASVSARDLFSTIEPDEVPSSLRVPHAVALANLVLLCGFTDLRETAVSLLAVLPEAGGEQDREIKSLLELLARPF